VGQFVLENRVCTGSRRWAKTTSSPSGSYRGPVPPCIVLSQPKRWAKNKKRFLMNESQLEERFDAFDEVLTPWLHSEGEFFAAVLLQTYAWWGGEQIDLGLDLQSKVPFIMHSDIAAIVNAVNSNSHGGPSFVIVP